MTEEPQNNTENRFPTASPLPSLKPECALYIYYEPGTPRPEEEQIARFVRHCHEMHVGCIIPRLCETAEESSDVLPAMQTVYRILLREAAKYGIRVAFNLEKIIETIVVRRAAQQGVNLKAQVLDRREYFCDENHRESIVLHHCHRLSLVAVNETYGEIIDLRGQEKDNSLSWDVPRGNWNIQEYYCEDDTADTVDYLDYDCCRRYLEDAWSLFSDAFEGPFSSSLCVLHYADICFHAVNRRNWSLRYNDVYRERFGYDPSPLYPHLYTRINEETKNAKAALFCCRAEMLQHGICRALYDFAQAHHLILLSTLTEPKLSAPSWITGDAILDNAYAPGALLDRSYLYGINSLKIAAAGAYNFDRTNISCELYRDYYKMSYSILYKDAINAFSRGANLVMAHTKGFHQVTESFDENNTAWIKDYADFVARVQSLLRGGTHVSDIAVLYPIHSLHSKVCLYRAPASGFEYPYTPSDTDYTTLINAIAFYAGYDITLLHPDVLAERCRAENGTIFLDNAVNREQFSILVLPSSQLIRRDTLLQIRRFYESGGKIIATGQLPKSLFEWKPGDHTEDFVREQLCAIFGERALDPTIIENIKYHANDCGGEAYLLYPSDSATDGTQMVDCVQLSHILNSFDLPQDIYLPTMPRCVTVGALNNAYPEFRALGLHRSIPGGGMLEHIHKRFGDTDVYFFGNTSDKPFQGKALLRGLYSLWMHDPHTGTTEKVPVRYARMHNDYYTQLELKLSPVQSLLFISDPDHAPTKEEISLINKY